MALGDEQELKVVVRATAEQLQRGMQEAAQAVRGAATEIRTALGQMQAQSATTSTAVATHAQETAASFGGLHQRVSVGLSGMSAQLRAFGEAATVAFAVLAGHRVFNEVIEGSQQWAFTVEGLSRRLGVTTQEASALAFAAKVDNIEIGQLEGALRSIARTLNTDEAAFRNLGIEVRDAKGQYLPLEEILIRTTERLKEFRAGTDQQVAATQVLKRSIGDLSDLLRVDWRTSLTEARELAEAFGLSLDAAGVAHARQFEDSVDLMKLAALGFSNVLAEALRPQLQAMSAEVIQLAKNGTFKSWAESASAAVGRLRDNVNAALSGLRALRDILASIPGLGGLGRYSEFAEGVEAARRRGEAASFVGPPEFGAGRSWAGTSVPGTTGTEGAPPSTADMAAARKKEFEELMRLEETALKVAQSNAAERFAITKHYSELIAQRFGIESEEFEKQEQKEVAARVDAEQEQTRVVVIESQGRMRQQLAEVDGALAVIQAKRQMGFLSAAEARTQERALADERLAIQLEALNRELDAEKDNVLKKAAIRQQITGVEQEHAKRLQEIQLDQTRQIVEGLSAFFGTIAQAFDRTINGMIQGTLRFRDAVRNMGQSVLAEFINLGARILAREAAVQATKLLLHVTTEEAISAVSTGQVAIRLAIEAAAAIKFIAIQAAKGAAAVWASLTETFGWVGAIIGVAAAAALFAGIIGYAASVSAAGGMDVGPAPVTALLHPREMVLPAEIAETVRGSVSGMSGGAPRAVYGTSAADRPTPVSVKDSAVIHVASVSGSQVDTRVTSVKQPVETQPASGAAPTSVIQAAIAQTEIVNPAGRPVFVHAVQMAGGMIAEVSSMGKGYGIGGGAGGGGGGGGGVGGAQHGADIRRDTTIRVHRGELVLPANLSEGIRQMVETGQGRAVEHHEHHYHTDIHAVDAASFKRLLENEGEEVVVKHVQRHVKRMNAH